jgi:hypothetical protein
MGPIRILPLAVMASLALNQGSPDVLAAPPPPRADGPSRPEIRKTQARAPVGRSLGTR